MTTSMASQRTVLCLLTSFCLRYGFAMPSVWLSAIACNLAGFNGFGFDYPLNSTWFNGGI